MAHYSKPTRKLTAPVHAKALSATMHDATDDAPASVTFASDVEGAEVLAERDGNSFLVREILPDGSEGDALTFTLAEPSEPETDTAE